MRYAFERISAWKFFYPLNEYSFRSYLKKQGKKDHVVAGLMQQVDRFAEFLASKRSKTLESASAPDLEAYLLHLDAEQPGTTCRLPKIVEY